MRACLKIPISESLLLAMNDHRLHPESEILGVLRDAAATHDNAAGPDVDGEMYRAVASLINQIIAGGNSARRP